MRIDDITTSQSHAQFMPALYSGHTPLFKLMPMSLFIVLLFMYMCIVWCSACWLFCSFRLAVLVTMDTPTCMLI